MNICVIDDHRINLAVLGGILAGVPDWHAEAFQSPLEALARCGQMVFDLVLVDHQMPELSGIEVIGRLRSDPRFEHVPIIMVTGDEDRSVKIEAIRAGATDFLRKPVDPEELRVRAANLLALRRAHLALSSRAVHLAHEVASATRLVREGEREMIERLGTAIEYRDDQTGGHIMRVAQVSRMVATQLGLDAATCTNIELAAQLHDAGKIGLPDSILLKPGRLTSDEVAEMRRHTLMGFEILRDGRSALVQMACDIALSHHERWDGNGYPQGLAGEAIPLAARIVAVADVHDALRSERPYKAAWDAASTRAELERLSSTAFDPTCVAALLRIWDAVVQLYSSQTSATIEVTA